MQNIQIALSTTQQIIESKFRENGDAKYTPKPGRSKVSGDKKINISFT